MLFRVSKNLTVVVAQNGAKHFSTSQQRNFQVTVCGAAGGIGQPLSLLLKQHPLVTQLNLFDLAPVTPGVACDLSHINSPAKACGFKGQESLDSAIKGSDLVIIPAGVPRKPGMSRDDLFNVNASIVRDIACSIAKNAPKAIVAIVTNPVNSMVPIAAEVLKKNNCYDPARVLGVTTLDVVRSATFIGEINGSDPRCVQIPVIGGHAGTTIIPVLSQSNPKLNLTDQGKIEALTKRIQEAGTEVVQAKAGGGSATLSMAFAAARLADAVLKGLKGEKAVECAYVASKLTAAEFFANPVEFGKNGVSKNLGYGKLNAYEEGLLKAAVPILQKNIKAGIDFVNK